jgi:polyisoprenyl-phosphate glycosyltransferase
MREAKIMDTGPAFSLIIPVYKNAESLPDLLTEINHISTALGSALEVVFVVDGSPDASYAILKEALAKWSTPSRLICHSRNFGSFAAIRMGLSRAGGRHFAVMAADLQDPPEVIIDFFRTLETQAVDVVVGTRRTRSDPSLTKLLSTLYWTLYRRFVMADIPPGGVDIFGCNLAVRDALCRLPEIGGSLVGLLFWLGFRRKFIPYSRRKRPYGRSGWGFRRKLRYLLDSVYAFTDLPISVLTFLGAIGTIASLSWAVVVLLAWMLGGIEVPGYTPTILLISFFGALNMFGLGIIGSYLWRTYENTKGRPHSIILSDEIFGRTS